MKVEVETLDTCRRQINITLAGDEVKPEFDKITKKYAKRGSVPGFRQGKAPRDVIAKRYAKQIEEEVRPNLVSHAIANATREEGISAYYLTDISEVQLDVETGLHFTVTLDVHPEFELADYKNLPVVRQPAVATDEMVQAYVDAVRRRGTEIKDVEEDDYAVAEGDICYIDYVAYSGERPLLEMVPDAAIEGEATDFPVVASADTPLAELGMAMIGAKVGDEREAEREVDEKHAKESMRGLKLQYRITLRKIRKFVEPELDEEFCKKIGAESVEKFMEHARSVMTQQAAEEEESRVVQQIGEYLLENMKFDLPASRLDLYTQRELRTLISQRLQRGETEDSLAEESDSLNQTAAAIGEQRLRLYFILQKIAEAEGLTVTKEEIDTRIALLARQSRLPEKDVRQRLSNSSGMSEFEGELVGEKAMAHLVSLVPTAEEK